MRVTRLLMSTCFAGLALLSVSALAVGLALVDKHGRDLPGFDELRNYVPQTGSLVLAADGTVLARHADQRRTYMPFGSIPPLVVQAFVSAEDKNYWNHDGVDYLAIVRAGLGYASGGRMTGASTITQQVAKNLLVGDEFSLERKVREALLATSMNDSLGKERIIEIYLNEIYLGMGAYGVAAAAEAFFSKPLEDLEIGEIALLAAMPKAPSAFDPRRNPDRARIRRDYVLARMAEDGVIPEGLARFEVNKPLSINPSPASAALTEVRGGWFERNAWASVYDYVKQDEFARTDVVVRTTLEPDLQNAAMSALRSGILDEDRRLGWRGVIDNVPLPADWSDTRLAPPAGSEMFTPAVVVGVDTTAVAQTRDGRSIAIGKDAVAWAGGNVSSILRPGDFILIDESAGMPVLAQMPDVEGALVAIDPKTGDVLALAGGFSHDRSVFDRATQAKRQAGSAFKTIVYLAALELGYDPTSPLLDASITLEQGPGLEDWRPSDARSAGKGGLITVRSALELSRNMASVRLLWDMGLPSVADISSRLGFSIDKDMTYAIALGAAEASPMQMALAYATIANGGRALRPRYVTAIETKDGTEVGAVPVIAGQQIVDPIAAAQMLSMLHGVVERGTAKTAFQGFDRPFAGKTGTTNGSRDAWFVGLSGDVAIAAWIGRDDNRPLANGASGGRTAAAIVRNFLDMSGDRFTLEDPPLPPGLETLTVDPSTGLPSTSGGAITELVRAAAPTLPPDIAPEFQP